MIAAPQAINVRMDTGIVTRTPIAKERWNVEPIIAPGTGGIIPLMKTGTTQMIVAMIQHIG